VRRLLLFALGYAALAAGAAAPAGAGSECEGLPACIRVVGPWVQVPAGSAPTYYRLSCPGPGQTIGGLDADKSGRVEVTFLGARGGPISPGVTVGRQAVFVGRPANGLATFRPLLGCIPASGGGARSRTVYEPPRSTYAAVEPVLRRVKTVRVTGALEQNVSHGCRAGERLLSFSSAVAFRTVKPPTREQLATVVATAGRSGTRITVRIHTDPELGGLRAEVQVHALCARRG